MFPDNSFDDTIFTFLDGSMCAPYAAKLVNNIDSIATYKSVVNDKYNNFPLLSIVYDNFALIFFFKVYINLQFNEMYIEFNGISHKDAEEFVHMFYDGVHTISLDNARKELKKYIYGQFLGLAHIMFKDTQFEFEDNQLFGFLRYGDIVPFLNLDKLTLVSKKKIAMRPIKTFVRDELERLVETQSKNVPIIHNPEYKIIEFNVYKNSTENNVYIINNDPIHRFIWGMPAAYYSNFKEYLSNKYKIYREVEG